MILLQRLFLTVATLKALCHEIFYLQLSSKGLNWSPDSSLEIVMNTVLNLRVLLCGPCSEVYFYFSLEKV